MAASSADEANAKLNDKDIILHSIIEAVHQRPAAL